MQFFERPVTPAEVSTELRSLIEQLVPGGHPMYVDVVPEDGQSPDQCFPLVEERVRAEGGTPVVGWSLWELPGLFVEAEFHCVWQRPDNMYLDIAQKKSATARVFFLADPSRRYEGRQVNNVRVPVGSDPQLIGYLDTYDSQFELLNRGDRANSHGEISLRGEEVAEYEWIQENRSTLYLQLLHRVPNFGPYLPCPRRPPGFE